MLRGHACLTAADIAAEALARRASRDALVRTLLNAAPGAELVERHEQRIEEAMADLAAGGADASMNADADASAADLNALPVIQALLDQLTRTDEQSWVDESIPALGGRTPRTAIRDADGRREVEPLLADMAWDTTTCGRSRRAQMAVPQ